MSTLLRDVIDIPERVGADDYVLRLTDSTGDDVTETLHRIKESTVKKEVEAAGFKLVAEGHDLDYASDDGTKRVFEADVKGKTHQFMLKFQKPRH